jgi:tRNA (guanine-N7-)-methyltransferase
MGAPGEPAGKDERRLVFGRHKGHRLRPRQAALLERLLPELNLDLSRPAPSDLGTLFPGPADEVHLEIGFGGGEHLAHEAEVAPRTGFIGCEPFVNGVAKLLVAVEERALGNIRIHADDARLVLDWLPDATISRVWLLYPDPWPKKRHRKRRFVSDPNLDALARIMRPGSELRFATDWAEYTDWTLRHLCRRADFDRIAETADDWRRPWPGWPGTRYETKAIGEGRVPCYLTFRRR